MAHWRCWGKIGFSRSPGNLLDLRGADAAVAVHSYGVGVRIEDGGFEADEAGTGVEDGVDAAVEVGQDVGGGGGADVAEAIGGGCG